MLFILLKDDFNVFWYCISRFEAVKKLLISKKSYASAVSAGESLGEEDCYISCNNNDFLDTEVPVSEGSCKFKEAKGASADGLMDVKLSKLFFRVNQCISIISQFIHCLSQMSKANSEWREG